MLALLFSQQRKEIRNEVDKLPSKYTKLINKYKPIETEGFTLYPITVEHYEEFLLASQAICFMQQALPIQLMSIPLLSAFFMMDLDRTFRKEAPTGLFTSAVLSLVLAMRLADDEESAIEVCKELVAVTDKENPTKLKALVFRRDIRAGREPRTITPYQYENIRRVIAAQNGLTIPDELDNPELVEAEHDLAEKGAPKLDTKVINMINAAAALTGKEEEEIYGWPILKLSRRLESFKRIIDYMVCAIGEGNGASWKNGNPTPHPFFDRIKGGSDALISMESFAGGEGLRAMQDAGAV